jgi:hypothetical protein
MPRKCIGECSHSSTILDLVTTWGWVISFPLRTPYSRGRIPWYTQKEGWMALRIDLDFMERSKIPTPAWNKTPAVQPVTRLYTD